VRFLDFKKPKNIGFKTQFYSLIYSMNPNTPVIQISKFGKIPFIDLWDFWDMVSQSINQSIYSSQPNT